MNAFIFNGNYNYPSRGQFKVSQGEFKSEVQRPRGMESDIAGSDRFETLTMANNPQITMQLGGDKISIKFTSERVTTSEAVERMGNRRYRLCSVPLFVESASFMDIIEAEIDSDGGLTFLRVVERSKWRVFDFMLSREFISSGKLETVLSRADKFGAHWERVFGGVLYICVPPCVVWNPTPEIVG